MRYKLFGMILIIIFAAVHLGCGTTSTITPSRSLKFSEGLPKLVFNSIKIEAKTEVEDSAKETKLLKESLINAFKTKNKEIKESGADVEMVAVIKHLKKVSRDSRLLWGSLAGKSETKVDVTITAPNTTPINFSVDTSSAGASSPLGWLSGYGGSTEEAIERTVGKIVNEILQ